MINNNKKWTEREIETLKIEYSKLENSKEKLEVIFNRSYQSIQLKASKLKIKRSHPKDWTKEEIELLKTEYLNDRNSDLDLEKIFNRSIRSIYYKANSIGLRRREFWTDDEVELLKTEWLDLKNSIGVLERIFRKTHQAICMKANKLGLIRRRNRDPIDRFLHNVNKKSGKLWNNTECWDWIGSLDKGGYGHFRLHGKIIRAHRFSYEYYIGPIAENLQLDHLCRNRRCTNPKHLEPVSQKENILRGESLQAINARKSHCKNGHEFSLNNIYLRRSGGRVCKECKKEYEKNSALEKKQLQENNK